MNRDRATREPLRELLSAMLDGELSDQQGVELCRLMHEDPAARKQYLRQATTLAMVKWSCGLPDAGSSSPTAQDDEVGRWQQATDELSSKMSLPSHLSSVIAGPWAWFPSGGVLLSYAIVALMLGAGVLATRVWKSSNSAAVRSPATVAQHLRRPRVRSNERSGRSRHRECPLHRRPAQPALPPVPRDLPPPAAMVLSDKAGREVVFAPAGRGAANSDLAANSDPAVRCSLAACSRSRPANGRFASAF